MFRTLIIVLLTFRSCHLLAQVPLADFNSDGQVGFIDLQILNVNLFKDDATFEEGDLNGDGFVNVFDVFGFNSQFRAGKGDGSTPWSPPGSELSLIVNSAGNMWAWGLLKNHPSERVLLMGYSIRSKAGNLISKNGHDLFDAFLRQTEFEVVAAGSARFRIDGARPLLTKVDPVDLDDLSFRYGTADGVFASFVHPGVPGDANLDGEVQFRDFLLLSANFGAAGAWGAGDFDHDGMVAFADFLALSTNFGQQLPGFATSAAAVPEPSGSVLSFCFAAMLLHTRWPRRGRVPRTRAKAV